MLDVILLFVSQTSTFDSPNSLYFKYLNSSDAILGVLEIRIRSVFHKQKCSFFFDFKVEKKNDYDRCYDIIPMVARIMRQCLFEKLFFTVFSIFTVIGF